MRRFRRKQTRVIIYGRGTAADLAEQDEWCYGQVAEHHYQLVGVAHDGPDESSAWDDARRMVKEGEADRILMSSATKIPPFIETVTGSTGRAVKRPGERRIRPVRRRDGGA